MSRKDEYQGTKQILEAAVALDNILTQEQADMIFLFTEIEPNSADVFLTVETLSDTAVNIELIRNNTTVSVTNDQSPANDNEEPM